MTSKPHSVLWWEAFKNAGHLCNGLCPDEEAPGVESRDPACFYCSVMSLEEQLEAYEQALQGVVDSLHTGEGMVRRPGHALDIAIAIARAALAASSPASVPKE